MANKSSREQIAQAKARAYKKQKTLFNGHPTQEVLEATIMIEYDLRQAYSHWTTEAETALSSFYAQIAQGNDLSKDDKGFDLSGMVRPRIEGLLEAVNGDGGKGNHPLGNTEVQSEWLMVNESGVPFGVLFKWLVDNRMEGEGEGEGERSLQW